MATVNAMKELKKFSGRRRLILTSWIALSGAFEWGVSLAEEEPPDGRQVVEAAAEEVEVPPGLTVFPHGSTNPDPVEITLF